MEAFIAQNQGKCLGFVVALFITLGFLAGFEVSFWFFMVAIALFVFLFY